MSDEGTHAFDDEAEDAMRSAPAGARRSGRLKWIVAAIAVIAVNRGGRLCRASADRGGNRLR
jgi:hypothetical protein